MIDDSHRHLKEIGKQGRFVVEQDVGGDTASGGVVRELVENETRWNYCVEPCGTRWNVVETGWN